MSEFAEQYLMNRQPSQMAERETVYVQLGADLSAYLKLRDGIHVEKWFHAVTVLGDLLETKGIRLPSVGTGTEPVGFYPVEADGYNIFIADQWVASGNLLPPLCMIPVNQCPESVNRLPFGDKDLHRSPLASMEPVWWIDRAKLPPRSRRARPVGRKSPDCPPGPGHRTAQRLAARLEQPKNPARPIAPRAGPTAGWSCAAKA